MLDKNQKVTTEMWKKIIFILLASNLSFGIVKMAVADSVAEADAQSAQEPQKETPVAETEVVETVDIREIEPFETSVQKAKEKINIVLKEKGNASAEITEARLELAKLELSNLMDRGEPQKFGALIALKNRKIKVLESILQRKAFAESSKQEAERSRIETERLKRELIQEEKDLAQEQKELLRAKKEEAQARREEAQAKMELDMAIRHFNRRIGVFNKKMEQ